MAKKSSNLGLGQEYEAALDKLRQETLAHGRDSAEARAAQTRVDMFLKLMGKRR